MLNLNRAEMPYEENPSLEDYIIYDEAGIIALNKPAGMVSQGSTKDEFSIAKGLIQLTDGETGHKPHLAHRLDRFTSGVILLACTRSHARSLQISFQERQVKKEYWALIDGIPEEDIGIVDAPIAVDGMFMGISPDGKSAQTEYHVFQSNSNGISFLGLKPHTGRRHQLRVHMAQTMAMPILGDIDYHPFYHQHTRLSMQRTFSAAALPETLNAEITGQMLHAHAITFMHPGLKREVTIEAPLSPQREKIWASLGFSTSACTIH